MGSSSIDAQPVLKLTSARNLPEETQVIVLEAQ
jgi:hypothetical protein